jgi:hypothetical protein
MWAAILGAGVWMKLVVDPPCGHVQLQVARVAHVVMAFFIVVGCCLLSSSLRAVLVFVVVVATAAVVAVAVAVVDFEK